MIIEYGLVFTFFSAQFDIPFSILFVQVTLLSLVNLNIKFMQKQKFLRAKLLRILYYVRRLCVSYRMNVRTSQKMLGVHR